MKKIFFGVFLLSCALVFSGCEQPRQTGDVIGGMQYVERDADGNVVSVNMQKNTETTANEIKNVNSPATTAVETKKEGQGMTKVLIINKETKKPVPGIGISIPYSSQMFYANNLGQAYVPFSYKEFSVPKINNYYFTGTIQNREDGKDLIIELQPEEAPGGAEVMYMSGFGKPSDDKSTYIYGTVKKSDGSPVINESISVLQSNLNTKTNKDGNFKLNVVGESNSYRLYLPNFKNNVYYQVDIFKGYALNINIKL